MSLAFPLPSHLPRANQKNDRTSSILSEISETTTIDGPLASSWRSQLDKSIHETKIRIYDRIHLDFPVFQRQFHTSQDVQARLATLSSNVDDLANSLNNPKTGLLPILTRGLAAHALLAKRSQDAGIKRRVLKHLLECRTRHQELTLQILHGEIAEASVSLDSLIQLMDAAPDPLGHSHILRDLRAKSRVSKDHVQELLDDAYGQCISIASNASATTLRIQSHIQVRQAPTNISLSAILTSLSPDTLTIKLAALRRDISSRLIDPILLSPCSVTTHGTELLLSFHPKTSSEHPLQDLLTLFQFLRIHLFSELPSPHGSTFCQSLYQPLASGILSHTLQSAIPNSISALPSFLGLVKRAVQAESDIAALIVITNPELLIKNWADGVGLHYERHRREDMLQRARVAIVTQHTVGLTVEAEEDTELAPEEKPDPEAYSFAGDDSKAPGWDFDGDDIAPKEADGSEEDGWGFQDDDPPARKELASPTVREADAWGWDDDNGEAKAIDDLQSDEDPWGDNWDTPAEDEPEVFKPPPEPSSPQPKTAKRFDKLSAKSKVSSRGDQILDPLVAPDLLPSMPSPPRPLNSTHQLPTADTSSVRGFVVRNGTSLQGHPHRLLPVKSRPTYVVSQSAKVILSMAEEAIKEGASLMESGIFPSSEIRRPGELLQLAGPALFDLYRALYPIFHSSTLARSSDMAMRFSNDCTFLAKGAYRLLSSGSLQEDEKPKLRDGIIETADKLIVVGKSWLEDSVEREKQAVVNFLVPAGGFMEIGDPVRFTDSQDAIDNISNLIETLGQEWKATLTPTSYHSSLGGVVEGALSQILEDILSLQDIPELESTRLGQICKSLQPLEKLFYESGGPETSVVVSHVPSWFKFIYLPEILEGSLADISYLFDEGHLVDYEVDELVGLVRALFSETPLRGTTISKIMAGSPVARDYTIQ